MPLLDHFRPPIKRRLPWPALHSSWIAEIAGRLNEALPVGYVAFDRVHVIGGVEIDIAALEDDPAGPGASPGAADGGGTAVATTPTVYTPPPAVATVPFEFPSVHEIQVFMDDEERTLVGAVELVSPGNKDRGAKRAAFVGKCLDYLAAGASVVIVDVVTNRNANLHNEIVQQLDAPPGVELPAESRLYAATYRPVTRGKNTQIDIWVSPFAVGDALPTMPLRLIADYFVPVELEATYTEACRRRRLIP